MVDMQMREKNLLECRNIHSTSPDALEDSTTCIDENPRPLVDGHHISGGSPMRIGDRASAPKDGYRQT